MDNNINILDELNKGASMGIEAIDIIINKVNDHSFRDLLISFREDYVDLSEKTIKLYSDYSQEDIHEVNSAEKLMTWYGIMKDTILDDSISKLAEIMYNGTNMGIVEARKILNHKTMDKDVHSLCNKYLKLQEKYLNRIKDYL